MAQEIETQSEHLPSRRGEKMDLIGKKRELDEDIGALQKTISKKVSP